MMWSLTQFTLIIICHLYKSHHSKQQSPYARNKNLYNQPKLINKLYLFRTGRNFVLLFHKLQELISHLTDIIIISSWVVFTFSCVCYFWVCLWHINICVCRIGKKHLLLEGARPSKKFYCPKGNARNKLFVWLKKRSV